jgi:uncharacterized protein YjbI with pentapeptide repeats/uncharacterized RDD family membrane protein YckC
MASPSIKQNNQRASSLPQFREWTVPLLPRRCAAWLLEVSLVAASALIPYGVGEYVRVQREAEVVPLSPVLAETRTAIGETFALPPAANQELAVPPLTNLLWWTALLAPVGLSSWQLYRLSRTGQTLPKQWLGVKVVTSKEDPPGLARGFVREGLGRYGVPLGVAYLIWRYSGAFPALGILSGLGGVMLAVEGSLLLLGSDRRPWHDRLAKTYVIDVWQQPRMSQQPYQVEIQSNWSSQSAQNSFTTIVLTARKLEPAHFHLLRWMRQHPGTTLVVGVSVLMVSVLGTFVGTQVYIQTQANQREFSQQSNQVFLALVEQLSSPVVESVEERRAVMIALARLDDPRGVPMLVDLLGQEETPTLIEALQQALVSSGVEALPYLRRLNQSLVNDLGAVGEGNPRERRLLELRLQASQRAIAKLLNLYSGQIHNLDLDRVDLASGSNQRLPFTLVLDRVDLSGNSFRSAILSQASLESVRFYGEGEDGRFGTFDDWISDLSGADLKEANLENALLQQVLIKRTNLLRANLKRANLQEAHLQGSNLSGAQLVGANLQQAILTEASLTGAELAEANFSLANLEGSNLTQVQGMGASFKMVNAARSQWEGATLSQANFYGANLQGADLSGVDLTQTDLREAQLQNASLQGADLSGADLRGANLKGANFEGVQLVPTSLPSSDQFLAPLPQEAAAANVAGVNFSQVKNLDLQQLDLICRRGGQHPQCP